LKHHLKITELYAEALVVQVGEKEFYIEARGGGLFISGERELEVQVSPTRHFVLVK